MGLSYESSEDKEEIECIEHFNDLSLGQEVEMLESYIIELKKSINKKNIKIV